MLPKVVSDGCGTNSNVSESGFYSGVQRFVLTFSQHVSQRFFNLFFRSLQDVVGTTVFNFDASDRTYEAYLCLSISVFESYPVSRVLCRFFTRVLLDFVTLYDLATDYRHLQSLHVSIFDLGASHLSRRVSHFHLLRFMVPITDIQITDDGNVGEEWGLSLGDVTFETHSGAPLPGDTFATAGRTCSHLFANGRPDGDYYIDPVGKGNFAEMAKVTCDMVSQPWGGWKSM